MFTRNVFEKERRFPEQALWNERGRFGFPERKRAIIDRAFHSAAETFCPEEAVKTDDPIIGKMA